MPWLMQPTTPAMIGGLCCFGGFVCSDSRSLARESDPLVPLIYFLASF